MSLKQRLLLGGGITALVWLVWLAYLGPGQAYDIVGTNWPVTVTMVFGSIIAGATSEGGGAVAFPVFTKLLDIPPWHAKVFSLAIQSVGMTAAALIIVVSRIPIEWRVIFWASLGGAAGMLFGAFQLAPYLPADVTKMTFTVMAGSFALVLMVMNWRARGCHDRLPVDGYRERGLLMGVGVIGGILSSLVGTGLDIVTFSVIVLLFRISEKVATPTSVVLMSINSIFGLFVFGVLRGPLEPAVISYWMSAIPVVVIGAPLGAIICAYLERKVISNILIGLILVEVATSILIIPMNIQLVVLSLAVLASFLLVYSLMMRSQRYEPSGDPA